MKSKLGLWIPAVMWLTTAGAQAQGTAFTYQGRLQDGTNHATGFYDLTFSVWTTPAGPAQLGGSVTNPACGVTNGLFAVTLDFGGGVFDGSPRWLEIGVRTNGGGAFTTLAPRQPLTPAPYAIHAGSVNAAGISGTIPAASIGVGTITSNMLAPGAAAANFAATGATILSTDPNATNLVAAGYRRAGGALDFSWQQITAALSPTGRGGHSAIWTGNRMIVWGGADSSGTNRRNTGNIYDPTANSWQLVTTNAAPLGGSGHPAIWTGTEMIIWGGYGGDYLNDGGRYNPAIDIWLPVATTNAPVARHGHTAVWTGNEMIVWGGYSGSYLNTGARYNPTSDSWTPISLVGAPRARHSHCAAWTGSKMLVWGGALSSYEQSGDGACYDPAMDVWLPMNTNGAPAARFQHTAVWTGHEFIVWGGVKFDGIWTTVFSNGGRYNPVTDSWCSLNNFGSPSERHAHTAVWTGREMIVFGGLGPQVAVVNTGGRYNPASDSWSPVPTTGAPDPRYAHSAVWSGTEMLIFGGYGYKGDITFSDAFAYAPSRVIYMYVRP